MLDDFASGLGTDYRRTIGNFLALQTWGDEHATQALRALRASVALHGEPDRTALESGLAVLRDSDLRGVLSRLTLPALVISRGIRSPDAGGCRTRTRSRAADGPVRPDSACRACAVPVPGRCRARRDHSVSRAQSCPRAESRPAVGTARRSGSRCSGAHAGHSARSGRVRSGRAALRRGGGDPGNGAQRVARNGSTWSAWIPRSWSISGRARATPRSH